MREWDVPLLIVRGSRDPVAGRDWCRRLRDAARRGAPVALVEIPGRAHNARHAAPGTATAAIARVLGALLYPRSGCVTAPLAGSRVA